MWLSLQVLEAARQDPTLPEDQRIDLDRMAPDPDHRREVDTLLE